MTLQKGLVGLFQDPNNGKSVIGIYLGEYDSDIITGNAVFKAAGKQHVILTHTAELALSKAELKYKPFDFGVTQQLELIAKNYIHLFKARADLKDVDIKRNLCNASIQDSMQTIQSNSKATKIQALSLDLLKAELAQRCASDDNNSDRNIPLQRAVTQFRDYLNSKMGNTPASHSEAWVSKDKQSVNGYVLSVCFGCPVTQETYKLFNQIAYIELEKTLMPFPHNQAAKTLADYVSNLAGLAKPCESTLSSDITYKFDTDFWGESVSSKQDCWYLTANFAVHSRTNAISFEEYKILLRAIATAFGIVAERKPRKKESV